MDNILCTHGYDDFPIDRIYSFLGIVGLRPSPDSIKYNVGYWSALRVLLEAMYIN